MDKFRQLVDLLSENKLNGTDRLLEEIIKEKLFKKLEEKKTEIALTAFNEQLNTAVQSMKKHARVSIPRLARGKNLRDRQSLENKLDSIARKRFK